MAKSLWRAMAGKREGRGSRAMLVATLVASAFMAAALPAGAHQSTPVAHAAHTLNADDTAHLQLVRASGSLLLEEGSASGGISGHMKANLDVGATFTGTFTISLSGGTIKGHGTATPHGSGRYESFGGSMVITGGSGRYAHIRGHGGMFGTFDRKTYAVVIQTTGKLSY
jgi:hypothetical protein